MTNLQEAERNQLTSTELLKYYQQNLSMSYKVLTNPQGCVDDTTEALHDLSIQMSEISHDSRLNSLHCFSKYIQQQIENTYAHDVCRGQIACSVMFMIETMSNLICAEEAHIRERLG